MNIKEHTKTADEIYDELNIYHVHCNPLQKRVDKPRVLKKLANKRFVPEDKLKETFLLFKRNTESKEQLILLDCLLRSLGESEQEGRCEKTGSTGCLTERSPSCLPPKKGKEVKE